MREPLSIERGRLAMSGVDLADLARRHGTPQFVYAGDAISRRAAALLGSLRGAVGVHYSLKANPTIAIAALMRRAGLGAEIASSGELAAARRAGFAPGDILFAGPGKTDDEIGAAVSSGVAQLNAESEAEIERIGVIADELGITQRVGIRLNPPEPVEGGRIVTAGGAQKFGIDESRALQALRLVEHHPSLELGGIHTMLGSQVLDPHAMLAHARRGIGLARELGASLGRAIPALNLGGGLGAAHADEEPFDLMAFGADLAALVERDAPEGTRVVIEPGRALLSDLGVYLTRVVDAKDSHGTRVVILDGGIHHALLPITANKYFVMRAERMDADDGAALVGGPLCTSADRWRAEAPIAGAEIGEVIAMRNAGAYGLTAGMTMFLSRGVPAEVLLLDGREHVIRPRVEAADALGAQWVPEGLA